MAHSNKARYLVASLCCISLVSIWSSCGDTQSHNALAQNLRNQDYDAISTQLTSTNPSERCAAANAIAWARSPVAAQIQLTLLTSSTCGWKTRVEAAWRLAELNYTGAMKAIQQLLSDKDRRIRWNAAYLLGIWGRMEPIEHLRVCERDDTDELVREWCSWAACRILASDKKSQTACTRPVMELFKRSKTADSQG